MKYMLMMNVPGKMWETLGSWSKDDFRAHVAFMHKMNKDLKDSGEFVLAEGLAMPREAVIVKAGKDGAPVSDGVFPESKEFLAGFWIIDVESTARAHEIAAKISLAPGAGGRTAYIPLEVRQVMAGPPPEML